VSAVGLRALGVCFFVSGATSLVLQVAWTKQLSYTLGTTLYAVTTVVAAFMGGLALGSLLASRWLGGLRRPVLAYAVLQALIAVCGLVSIPLLRATPALYGPVHAALGDWPMLFFAARFALVFLLLVMPVTLMGMTLPLMAGVFARGSDRYERETGLLYGINTLGAVSGTLLAGFVLVPRLGLFATCASVGAADALVGLIALAVHTYLGAGEARAVSDPEASGAPTVMQGSDLGHALHAGWIGAIYAVSGAAAIALEVGWFRYLAFVFGPTADAFSVMLATYLAGIGLGSLVGARMARLTRSPLFELARLQLLLALGVVLSAAIFNPVPGLYGRLYWGFGGNPGLATMVAAQSAIAALIVLPGTLLLGALFPVAVRCFAEASRTGRQAERTVGRLYGLNTVGGIAGSFLTGFWLVPQLGVMETVFLASGVNGLLGLLLLSRAVTVARGTRLRWSVASVGALALLIVATPPLDLLALNKGSYLALSNEDGFRHRSRRAWASLIALTASSTTSRTVLFGSSCGSWGR
jgi:spermidine synthase